jgi:hypothetical protein
MYQTSLPLPNEFGVAGLPDDGDCPNDHMQKVKHTRALHVPSAIQIQNVFIEK